MQLTYTYWQAEEGGYIGYWNDYPEFWTQGETEEELKDMLLSLYQDIADNAELSYHTQSFTGVLSVPA